MLIRAALLITLSGIVYGTVWAEDGGAARPPMLAAPAPRYEAVSYKEVERERVFSRSWKISLLPLFGSQALDAASSYGMRELNPLLADGSGRFGMKATAIKFGAVGAFAGIQYLVIRKHPGAARTFTKLNWATGAVTTSFAAHNFTVR